MSPNDPASPPYRFVRSREEFLEAVGSGAYDWGVVDLDRATELIWGRAGTRRLRYEAAAGLAPSILFGVWCLARGHYAATVWSVLGVLAFRTGRPDMSCGGGCCWIVSALVGIVLGFTSGPINLVGGILPPLNYFLSSVFVGTALNEIGIRLRTSVEDFERVAEAGILVIAPKGTCPVVFSTEKRP